MNYLLEEFLLLSESVFLWRIIYFNILKKKKKSPQQHLEQSDRSFYRRGKSFPTRGNNRSPLSKKWCLVELTFKPVNVAIPVTKQKSPFYETRTTSTRLNIPSKKKRGGKNGRKTTGLKSNCDTEFRRGRSIILLPVDFFAADPPAGLRRR